MNGCAVTMVFPKPGIGARLFPATSRPSSTTTTASRVEVLAGETVATVDGHARHDRKRARCSRPTASWPASGSSRRSSSRRDAGLAVATASSSTSSAAPADARTSSPRATSRASRSPRSAARARRARGPRQQPRARRRARTWPAPTTPYDHLPFFYSDLFELGYEAVGELDSRHEMIAEWKEPNRTGVVCYVDGCAGRGASCSGTSGAASTPQRPDRRRRAGHPGHAAHASRLRCRAGRCPARPGGRRRRRPGRRARGSCRRP